MTHFRLESSHSKVIMIPNTEEYSNIVQNLVATRNHAFGHVYVAEDLWKMSMELASRCQRRSNKNFTRRCHCKMVSQVLKWYFKQDCFKLTIDMIWSSSINIYSDWHDANDDQEEDSWLDALHSEKLSRRDLGKYIWSYSK